jgi:hypothetical protein
MKEFIGARRARTLAGLVIFAGLAPFLLALMACLDAPIGDPERSLVDPAITGVWISKAERTLWVVEPWDKRTWITTWLKPDTPDPAEASEEAGPQDDLSRFEAAKSADVAVFKTWLTEIGGVRFLVLEPKTVVQAEGGMTPGVWLAYALNQPDPAHIELRLVDQAQDAKTTAEAEAFIRAHAKDGKLFGEGSRPAVLHRIPEADYGRVEKVLKHLDVGLH